LTARVDHVVVSGDITHRGRREEYARFRQVFHPLLRSGRMTVVPGNHDRLGDDVRMEMTGGLRVARRLADGLCIVTVDSTAPHNRSWLASHGEVSEDELGRVEALLDDAPRGTLKVIALHHHPLPLPEDTLSERLVTRLGSQNGRQLPIGPQLVRRLCGSCDLVLHGHRHIPRELLLCANERPRLLRIVNAGSSTTLGMVRVFTHANGRLRTDPYWLSAPVEDRLAASRRPSLGVWDAVRSMGIF
jgi:3',5'-cyclic AMP phosphodiesterase CpdA